MYETLTDNSHELIQLIFTSTLLRRDYVIYFTCEEFKQTPQKSCGIPKFI